MRALLLLVTLLSAGSLAAFEYAHTGVPEFKFEVPPGFTAVPNEPGDIATLCGFQKGNLDDPTVPSIGIFFEGYGNEIDARAVNPKDFKVLNPQPLTVQRKYLADWNGDSINAAYLTGSDPSGAYTANVHTAWVPTKGEALILTVLGANVPETTVQATLNSVLASLVGPSSGGGAMAVGIGLTVGAVVLFAIIGLVVVQQRKRPVAQSTYGGGYSAGSYGPPPAPPSGGTSTYKPKRPDAAPWE